jgi:hypothetical protein
MRLQKADYSNSDVQIKQAMIMMNQNQKRFLNSFSAWLLMFVLCLQLLPATVLAQNHSTKNLMNHKS